MFSPQSFAENLVSLCANHDGLHRPSCLCLDPDMLQQESGSALANVTLVNRKVVDETRRAAGGIDRRRRLQLRDDKAANALVLVRHESQTRRLLQHVCQKSLGHFRGLRRRPPHHRLISRQPRSLLVQQVYDFSEIVGLRSPDRDRRRHLQLSVGEPRISPLSSILPSSTQLVMFAGSVSTTVLSVPWYLQTIMSGLPASRVSTQC